MCSNYFWHLTLERLHKSLVFLVLLTLERNIAVTRFVRTHKLNKQ